MNLLNFLNRKRIKKQFYKHSLSYDHDDFDKNMGKVSLINKKFRLNFDLNKYNIEIVGLKIKIIK